MQGTDKCFEVQKTHPDSSGSMVDVLARSIERFLWRKSVGIKVHLTQVRGPHHQPTKTTGSAT